MISSLCIEDRDGDELGMQVVNGPQGLEIMLTIKSKGEEGGSSVVLSLTDTLLVSEYLKSRMTKIADQLSD